MKNMLLLFSLLLLGCGPRSLDTLPVYTGVARDIEVNVLEQPRDPRANVVRPKIKLQIPSFFTKTKSTTGFQGFNHESNEGDKLKVIAYKLDEQTRLDREYVNDLFDGKTYEIHEKEERIHFRTLNGDGLIFLDSRVTTIHRGRICYRGKVLQITADLQFKGKASDAMRALKEVAWCLSTSEARLPSNGSR